MMVKAYVTLHGDVWLQTAGAASHIARGSELLAVAWSPQEGVMVKQGSHTKVSQWLDKGGREKWEPLFGPITVFAFPVHEATVELMTKICENPSRAAGLEAELVAIGVQYPDLVMPPRIPD